MLSWQLAVVHPRHVIDGMRLSLPMHTGCSLVFFALVPAASHLGPAIFVYFSAAACQHAPRQVAYYAGEDAGCTCAKCKTSHFLFRAD